MRVGRRKQTLNSDFFVHLFDDTLKFKPMHIFAIVLTHTPFQPTLLGRTVGCTNKDLVIINLDLVLADKKPWIDLDDLHKCFQAFLFNAESLLNFAGHEPSHSAPDLFIESNCCIIAKFIFHPKKPKSVCTAELIEQELKLISKFFLVEIWQAHFTTPMDL
jgi:hypothetical protein